ncbi:MAG: hypothetical protein IT190_04260, partial [Microbacteriaceae bacterium]|nr:hypothetical protein [Microbacteriaceae bacterium]
MARSISEGDTESAIRGLTERVGRMILASDKGEQTPDVDGLFSPFISFDTTDERCLNEVQLRGHKVGAAS